MTAAREIVSGALADGFGPATGWLATAKLSPAETAASLPGLTYFTTRGETGDWIGWLGKNLPAGTADERIGALMREWTQSDYQAAGKWLAAAPAGGAKDIAVRSYAVAVAEYDPETAAQWAMKLPPGQARDETLGKNHRNWPKDDPASRDAAEVFRKEHGIE